MKLKKCIFTLVVMLSGFSATVFAEGNVAKIENTEYATLADAIEQATADATITLLADVNITESTTIGKNITLDLDGHIISETVTDQFGAIYVKKGATLTIKAATGGAITTDGGVVIGNYGTVIVDGGTINAGENSGTDVSIYNFYYQADYYGTMTINGGTVGRIWNCGVATLAGGTITDVDNSGAMEIKEEATVTNIILKDGSHAPEVPNKGELTGAANLRVTMDDGFKAVYDNGVWTATTEPTDVVAHIGGTYYYKSLADALGAAKTGETVTLDSDIAASEIIIIDKAITLDGGSKKLTSTAGRAINIDCADEVTIKDLSIVGSTGCQRGINIINKAGTTNINNVTISDVSHYALHVATSANAAKVNVTDSDLSGWAAIASYGSGAEVTVTNSKLTGINDKADNASNIFSTIALGTNTSINVDGQSTISAQSSEENALQLIVGATAGVTGANATISATLNVEGTALYVGMDLSEGKDNSLTIKEEYKDEVWEEGYATETQEDGMIAVKLIPTLSLNDDFDGTLPTGTVTKVTYTRQLTAENTWYALYLPFQVPVNADFLTNYDVAEFSQFNNNEGAMSITASLIVGETSLAANTPYLIRAKNVAAKNLSLVLENVIVNAEESQTYSEIEGISLTGVYEETAASEIPNAYALSYGVFKKGNEGTSLRPFRFYLEIKSAQAAALKTIAINVDGEEDGTTSIDNSIFTNDETVAYDLQGRRVENPAKGIYIVNGKKVVIK